MADPRQVGTFNLAFRPAPITSQPPNNDRSWPSQGSSRHARSSHLHDLPGRQHPHRKVLAQIHGQTPQHEPLSEAARQRLVHKVDNLLSSLLHASHHNHPMKLLALHPDKQIYHRTVAALVTFDRLLAQREGLAAREPTNASPDDDDASLLKDVLTKLKGRCIASPCSLSPMPVSSLLRTPSKCRRMDWPSCTVQGHSTDRETA